MPVDFFCDILMSSSSLDNYCPIFLKIFFNFDGIISQGQLSVNK